MLDKMLHPPSLMSVAVAVEVRNLTRSFGRLLAISQLNFSLADGEVVGFLGPNGAGKTTTLKILAGLIGASSGEAYLGGRSIARHGRPPHHFLSYLGENNAMPGQASVAQYLRLRVRLRELDDGDRAVANVLQLCNLTNVRHRMIAQLSHGYRRRVGLADALLGHPRVLLLDEPTAGLDPCQVGELRRILSHLPHGPTILFSSHVLGEVDAFCHRMLILNAGRLIADGTRQDLCQSLLANSWQSWHARTLVAGGDGAVARLAQLDGVRVESCIRRRHGIDYVLALQESETVRSNVLQALARDAMLVHWERDVPLLESIFLAATRHGLEETS